MSVINLAHRNFLKNFEEIERNPSKKLEIYSTLRESLKSFLEVHSNFEPEIISSPELKKMADNISKSWLEIKASENKNNQQVFDHFKINDKMPIIDAIYTRLDDFGDIPQEYKGLLKDEGEFIKKTIDFKETEEVITANNITTINTDGEEKYTEEIRDFFTWQFNDSASDYFSMFQSLYWSLAGDEHLNPKDLDKLRTKLFNYRFSIDRNYSGRKFKEKNGDYSAEHIGLDYEIFWLTPDLEFVLDSQSVNIKCEIGEIHLRIESFFNLFVGDHDWNSAGFSPNTEGWASETFEELIKLNADVVCKNVSSLHQEFKRYREHNGCLVLTKSQMENLYRFFQGNPDSLPFDAFRFPKDYFGYFENWELYPEFTRYFVLILMSVDHHANVFLPNINFVLGNKPSVSQQEIRDDYYKNMVLIYNLLKGTDNTQLSWNILILFLNTTLQFAYKTPHWVKIAELVESDFPSTIKIPVNNFMRDVAALFPENEQTLLIQRMIKPTILPSITDFDGKILNIRIEPEISFCEEEESETLEFKQTFSFDTRLGKKSDEIRFAALKEITGFLNTRSGCLLIGIHDKSKEITGIEQDGFQGDFDKYSRLINDLVATSCGETAASLLSIDFQQFSDRTVCKILCKKSSEPIYCGHKNNPKSPFGRYGSITKLIPYDEWDKWRKEHFKPERN